MSNSGITIPIKAIADISGVSSAFNRLFGGANARGLKDYQRDMDKLKAALIATGQAGKNINRVIFDPAASRAELQTLTRIRQELEAIARTKQGRQWRAGVIGSGQDWNKPWTWDYSRMGSNGASLQRRMAEGAPSSTSWGALGSWGMGQARGAAGTVAGLAVGTSVVGALLTGYREHLATLESVDTIFKSIGSSGGFKGVMDDTRALGNALQMTAAEASHLASRFVHASGAINQKDAYGQAQFAGQFGRGMGVNPNTSADLMARSSLVGYGNTKQSQRDFAATIGQTIAGSGMQARSEQVMGALVEQIENIATHQGRTAGAGEMGNFADMLRTLLKDPALRGGGANTIMSIGKQLGGEGGPMADALATMAYGPAVGNRLNDILRIQQADENTPLSQIPGLGAVADGYGDKTRRELALAQAEKYAQGTPWDTSYVMSRFLGIGTMQQNDVYQKSTADMLRQQEVRKTGGYKDWMKGTVGTGYQDANPSGFGITADIYENLGKPGSKEHVDRLTGLANQYKNGSLLEGDANKGLREALDKAMQPGNMAEKLPQLQLALAKIAAKVGSPETQADVQRQESAKFINKLSEMGSALGDATSAVRKFANVALGIVDVVQPSVNPMNNTSESVDTYQLGQWKQLGFLNDDFSPKKPFQNPENQKKYQEIMERKRLRAAGQTIEPQNTPASPDWKPSWGDQVEDSGATGAASAGVTPGRNHLLSMIAGPESGGNYNAMYKAANQTDHDLTGMTMDEIDALQTKMIDERGGSAIGKYQYLRKTLRGLRSDMGIGGDEIFDKPMQDRLAIESLRRRGLEGWEAGTTSDADFQAGIAEEWAGVPKDASGLSAHEGKNGNHARIPHSRVTAAFEAARTANATAAAPAAPAEASPAGAPAAPVASKPATAPASPVAAAEPKRDDQWNGGKPLSWMPDPDDLAYSGLGEDVYEWQRANDPGNPANKNKVPKTPNSIPGATGGPVSANVNGQVGININVAKDGRPLETSAHQLSFRGEPRVYGSGGSQPSRVEWSRTV